MSQTQRLVGKRKTQMREGRTDRTELSSKSQALPVVGRHGLTVGKLTSRGSRISLTNSSQCKENSKAVQKTIKYHRISKKRRKTTTGTGTMTKYRNKNSSSEVGKSHPQKTTGKDKKQTHFLKPLS